MMSDQQAEFLMTEATVQRLRNEWKQKIDAEMAALRDEFDTRLQAAGQDNNAGWFVRRIEALERENLALRLERDRAIAQPDRTVQLSEAQIDALQHLKVQNEALVKELRQAQAKLDGFRQLLDGNELGDTSSDSVGPSGSKGSEESQFAIQSTVQSAVQPRAAKLSLTSSSTEDEPKDDGSGKQNGADQPRTPSTINGQGSGQVSRNSDPETAETQASEPIETRPKARGPKSGKAFHRAEAIFLGVKDWNRQNPTETFAINPGVLETVFHVHRQAAKDFFNAYQNELWEYHQEINVESPRWHNRGKDMDKLKEFVEERINGKQGMVSTRLGTV